MPLKCLFIDDTREDSTHSLVSVSWDTDIFALVEIYLEDGLKMAIHQWH